MPDLSGDRDLGVALVTGAAQGIGQRIAVELANAGFSVAANDLREPVETVDVITQSGSRAMSVAGDVGDERSVTHMVEHVLDAWGRIDVLVNNAGVSLQRRAEETVLAEWEQVLRVNLTGPFLLCREVGTHMLTRNTGSIINIASIAGLMGFADRAAYNASKHGLVGLTRTLAVEWGGRGIRANAVCPGWVKTEMDARDQVLSGYTDEDITDRIPMARFASPDDIARAVVFLADSRVSGFINGQCLTVDGGWSVDGGWQSLRLSHR